MQLEHLILFDKISSEKSISKVAEESHLSQPALSQKMRKLEEEMDVKLFERSNKGIELTEAGRTAQRYFHHMINVFDQLREELGNLKQYSGTVRILASPVIGQYALPCSVHKMSESFPGYTFSLSIMTSSEVIRAIRDGNGNIGFIVGSIDSDIIKCKQIYSDKILLICSPAYYEKDNISLDELRKYPLITLVERFSTRRILQQDLKKKGYSLEEFHTLMELDSTESVKASLLAKLGFAFLPYMSIKKELYLNQLKVVEIPDFKMDTDLYMVHKETDSYEDVPKEIITHFENVAKESFC